MDSHRLKSYSFNMVYKIYTIITPRNTLYEGASTQVAKNQLHMRDYNKKRHLNCCDVCNNYLCSTERLNENQQQLFT
jgi:hypothetical protein